MLEVSRSACLWLLPVSHMVGVTRPLLLLALLLCLRLAIKLSNTINLTPLTISSQHEAHASLRRCRQALDYLHQMSGYQPTRKHLVHSHAYDNLDQLCSCPHFCFHSPAIQAVS